MRFSKVLSISLFAAVATALPSARSPGLDEVIKVFKREGVVPDVLSSFSPVAYLHQTYTLADGSFGTVTPGTPFARDDTQKVPEFAVKLDSSITTPPGVPTQWPATQRFVLLTVDPDAPSRANPTRGQIRHYLATNLVLSDSSRHVSGARILTSATVPPNPYRGPGPPAGSGPHRYVSVLYAQPANLDISFLDLTNISNFNLEAFAKQAKLGAPLAATFFTSEVL